VLLRAESVARAFGGRVLFCDVSLTVGSGDRIGLVGPNGAGKTTLLQILGGDDQADEGQVSKPREVRVGLLRQEIDPSGDRSVRDEVATVFSTLDALEREMRELEERMERGGREGSEVSAALADRYDRCRVAFEFGGGFEREARVERVLEGLGFDAERRARPLCSFSGGWLMRVELAKLLLSAPDVLLLDEPTNHLDLPSIQWFEETLAGYAGAAVIVSHDRTFLRRHVTRVAELEAGRFTLFEGNYDRYLKQKAELRAHLLAQQSAQEREIARTERFIERFRYKATKARQVQSRVRALERMERVEVAPERRVGMRLRIPTPARAGEVVLRLEAIHKRYGENSVYRGVDLLIRRGDRVALAGPNGAGKSTLLRIAAGVLPFEAGERQLGHKVQVALFGQHQLEVLDPRRTVLEELEHVAHTEDIPRLRGHLGAFLFSGDDVEKKVSVLSGGEKARLALARLLLRPANFLVLDEPTNHLDLAACEVLEQALAGYAGTLLFISHDRTLINALATRIVEVRAGVLREFAGNYDRYLDAATEAPAMAAPEPAEGEAAPAANSKRERIAERERSREQVRHTRRAQRRLATLEAEIAALEGELEALSERLGAPEVYRDGEVVRAIEAERGEIRASLGRLYSEWEGLAAELESAE
jgi:ATP-binding cassette subfamily F protein 3